MNTTTIDKVKLFNPNFNLTQIETFGINSHNKQPNKPISESACCFLESGEPVIGQNIFINSDIVPYHLNIKVNGESPQAWLTFNPNKFESIEKAIQLIDSSLKNEHRFEIDLFDSKLSRVDIARDCTMNHIARAYQEPKKHLAKTRYYSDKTEYPDSILYKTNGWQLSDYDKGKKNQLDLGLKATTSTNHLRSELRLVKPSYVAKHLGFSDFATLVDLSQSEINKAYVNTSNKFLSELQDLSKIYPRQDIADVIELMPSLMQIRDTKQRIMHYIINQSLMKFDIVTLRHNYIESFTHYLDSVTFNHRATKSRKKKIEIQQLDLMLREIQAMHTSAIKKSEHSLKDRIKEYQEKILVA